jgi:hypothetical protein
MDAEMKALLAEVAAWHRRMNLELSDKGSEWAAKEMYACQHGKFATALERALEQPASAAGFVMVPEIATREMVMAMNQVYYGKYWLGPEEVELSVVQEAWTAMIAAAPKQEARPPHD